MTDSVFKLATKDGKELAYSFTTEAECLGVPARDGLFIIEKNTSFFMGWRIAYIGTNQAGWQRVQVAETVVPPAVPGPIVDEDGAPL